MNVSRVIEEKQIWTVSQLNSYVGRLFDADALLRDISVRGEISNFTHHSSGHMYFTLKDASSQLRCVMFSRENLSLSFRPVDGDLIVAAGYAGVYEKRGEYQLYVSSMSLDGVGALYAAFERLKRQLEAEGLFDPIRKRRLPRYPQWIGIATSPTGAAVHDMIRILQRRWPSARITVIPTVVQGSEAVASIVQSMDLANQLTGLDLLIVGRGGGSLEDLWCFNDERVARAAFASRLPIVSAVGHETDFTILDFVADLRAATPSAAAEMVVPDARELEAQLSQVERRLARGLVGRLESGREWLSQMQKRRAFIQPKAFLAPHWQVLDDLHDRSRELMSHRLRYQSQCLQGLNGKLQSLSPRSVLTRGYCLLRDKETQRGLFSVTDVRVPSEAEVVMKDGRVDCRVSRTEPQRRDA